MAVDRTLIHRRHSARRLAMQAIYSWQLADTPLLDLLADFRTDIDYPKADSAYFEELVSTVVKQSRVLDALVLPYLARSVETVDPVERAILRLATYELQSRMDIPYRVVLDEAIGLARKFGGTDGHKFINGVLDKLIQDLRSLEKSAEK
ncbi:unnamed protein product [Cyprideis torosa]|uniref:NusB/RsmB/TIM44 domain-containing protein n=1 Tax=Cyprideis torosa TaxID=163714 RepID=A0A7R8ZVF1_9CRUS|nr:unnamed protein product [Cyprideis torosa]CAG0910632.1 unnamed protein product [Cyprideis torosa]